MIGLTSLAFVLVILLISLKDTLMPLSLFKHPCWYMINGKALFRGTFFCQFYHEVYLSDISFLCSLSYLTKHFENDRCPFCSCNGPCWSFQWLYNHVPESCFYPGHQLYPARAGRRACALRALGLLLADGVPTVGGGKTFWRVTGFFYENCCNSVTESQIIDPKVGN